MEIKYTEKKKSINIYSEAKVLSSKFKQWFFDKLIEKYDLYEMHEGEGVTLLTSEVISKNMILGQKYIMDLKEFYSLNKILDISLDEFIDSNKFLYQNVYVVRKGSKFDIGKWKNNEEKIAKIDLEPDGSWNCLWLDIFAEPSIFIKLIDQYNNKLN